MEHMILVAGAATVVGAFTSVLALWIGVRGRQIQIQNSRLSQRYYLSYGYQELEDLHVEPKGMKLNDLRPNVIIIDESHRVVDFGSTDTMNRPSDRPSLRRMRRLVTAQRTHATRANIPIWALGLLAPEDAQRYAWEWGAHLHQLIEEGELRQARIDRRRLALAAVTLAVALRVRRVLKRAR
jgi:hypothetical protein